MIEDWKNREGSNFARSWLKYLGIADVCHLITPVDMYLGNSENGLYSYDGCIYLAERLSEEYRKWLLLYRMGVLDA